MGDGPSAIRELATNPRMLSEVKIALPILKQRALAPSGEDGVRRVVGRRMALYPPPAMEAAEWAAWWQDYYAALGDLPESALEAGMAAHVRDPKSEFMPKPGRLRALALDTPNIAVKAYDRAKAALAHQEPAEPPPRVDREAIERMMADYRAKVVRPEIRPERTSWGAPPQTDGDGISPALRKVMAERVQDNG